ncbi:MAG TPA: hypothetical protein VJH69_01940 [Candidatus Paceibacterota bacterium]
MKEMIFFHISEFVDSLQRVGRRIARVAAAIRNLLFHVGRFTGIAKRTRSRRLSVTGRRNSSLAGSVTDWNEVLLNSEVQEERTFVLFGRVLHAYNVKVDGTGQSIALMEDKERAREQFELSIEEFFRSANPERLPVTGDIAKKSIPEVKRRAIAFLTGESKAFQLPRKRPKSEKKNPVQA